MRFKAKYEVADGYFGGSNPHYFYIDEDWLHDDLDEEYLMGVLNDAIQEDFEMNIHPFETCKEEYLAWCKSIIEKRKAIR